jgi:TatA/E family protein of Tat protein translocase
MGIGTPELLIILIICLLLFGANRIPEIARSLGKAISEFKKGTRDALAEPEDAKKDVSPPVDKDAGK